MVAFQACGYRYRSTVSQAEQYVDTYAPAPQQSPTMHNHAGSGMHRRALPCCCARHHFTHAFVPAEAQVDVLNRGFGGYNTRWALFLLDGILSSLGSQDVALATLFFGANDAALPGRTGWVGMTAVQRLRLGA